MVAASSSSPSWQDAPAAAPTSSFWQWLWSLAREPGVIEILLAAAIVAAVVLVWWRLAALVRNARAREALTDYLLGVEQALHGDLAGAQQRLTTVLELDPENHFARLLYGKVLAELGQAEQAHQQHLYLQRGFGLDSPENDLMLAQSLLGAGLPREAADAAERALAKLPQHAAGWDFAYRARLQAGDPEGAMRAGRRLVELVRDGGERAALRRELARTVAQVGTARWFAGDHGGARSAVREASSLDASADGLPLLAARLDAAAAGLGATAARLVASGGSERLPVAASGGSADPRGDEALPMASSAGLPTTTFAGLLAPERWACRACGLPLGRAVPLCPRCRAPAPAELREPRLIDALPSATAVMDRIDVNAAHVQRLVQQLLDGPDADRRAARDELVELRENAVEELLRTAWRHGGDRQQVALDALQAMGPAITPALFAASDALGRERLLPLGERSPAALVGRVVQHFDRSALPHVESLFASARADHRRILIDYFLGLADLDAFQRVLQRFPPMEILHRLNHAAPDVLRRFLQAVPRDHFVATSLLVEPTFYRDEAVLAAVPGAADGEVLIDVLLRRGPGRSLTKVLIDAVGDAELAATAARVLRALGEPVTEHVLAAYVDNDREPAERERLGRVLVELGAVAAPHVADSFGPEPTAFDDQLRAILVAIGDPCIDALLAAYDHTGWLEKVSVGLISRHTNRRVQIVLALAELGSTDARAALRTLHDRERDQNLRLRLARALHALGDGSRRVEGDDD